MNDAFLDLLLACATPAIVVIGTAKNAGKTTVVNALRAAASRRGITGGLTSIGRDGEAADALDGAPKPRVRIGAGTVVAIPRDLLVRSPAWEILDVGERSALGSMIFARARAATMCEIGGPPTARGMRATIDRLRSLATGPVFVDGAIDRIAPLAGGDDAVVLATGGASGDSVEAIADLARATTARLRVPVREARMERAPAVIVEGALDARDAYALLARPTRATVVVNDPTRIAVRGKLFDRLNAAHDLRCVSPLRVVACTTAATGARQPLDPRTLAAAVAAATGLPVFDVVADISA